MKEDLTYSPYEYGSARIAADDFDDFDTPSTSDSGHHGDSSNTASSADSADSADSDSSDSGHWHENPEPSRPKYRSASLPDALAATQLSRTSRAASLPGSSDPALASRPATSPRKLSRKLPPRLTESLENLSIEHAQQRSAHSSPRTTLDPYILEVEVPEDDASSNHVPQVRRKKSLKQILSRRPSDTPRPLPPLPPLPAMPSSLFHRASQSSSSRGSGPSSHILTPSSSRHFARYSVESGNNTCSSGSASTCGTWSNIEDHDAHDAHDEGLRRKETRAERKARRKAEDEAFNVDQPPSMRALYDASLLDVIDEEGQRVKFGDLVRRRRTIVVFIRHWFCPLCAQYMNSIVSQVSPDTLEEADVDLVIIGNGSRKMVSGYRSKALQCPFPIYTDPSLQLYRALGLTRQTGDAGADADAGDYLVQTAMEATVATVKRATQMPLRNPGHFTQLGGEFVFDGTLNVMYTHRMSTTRAHSPIRDVCAAAGVRLEWVHYEPGLPPPPVHRRSIIEEVDEEAAAEEDWRSRRDDEIDRMRRIKEQRRMGGQPGYRPDQIRVVGEDEEPVEFEDDFENLRYVSV